MEVDVFDGDAVHAGLGDGEPSEDVQRAGTHGVLQGGLLEQRAHVRPRSRRCVVSHLHVDLAGAEARPHHLAADQPHRLDADRVHRRLEQLERHARVDERPEKHVAADAGRAVEPADHRLTPARSFGPPGRRRRLRRSRCRC